MDYDQLIKTLLALAAIVAVARLANSPSKGTALAAAGLIVSALG